MRLVHFRIMKDCYVSVSLDVWAQVYSQVWSQGYYNFKNQIWAKLN